MADALLHNKWVELDAEKAEDPMESDQAQEIVAMIRSSIVASEEIKEWKTA